MANSMTGFGRSSISIDGRELTIELKSVKQSIPAHRAQLFNYLRLTQKKVGLLINFGGDSLEGERYVYDESTNHCYMVDRNMEPIPFVNEDDQNENYVDPYENVIVHEA